MNSEDVHHRLSSYSEGLCHPIGSMSKTYPDGHSIAQHFHSRNQLLYATSGVMRLRTDDEAWLVPPGLALCIPAGLSHSVNMHGSVSMRTLYIDASASAGLFASLSVVSVSDLLRELILAVSEMPADVSTEKRNELVAKLILVEIENSQKLRLQIPLPRDPRLQRLCARLFAQPSDARTLGEWADVVGASERTLSRLFGREMGVSFAEWRQRMRFQNALEELSNGDSIARVAKQNGYRSSSAFSAAFRKSMGYPPSKTR